MLECPKCGAAIQVNFPADGRIKDVADMSRQRRMDGGSDVLILKCGICRYEGDPLEFDPRSLLPKVKDCYIALSGMVAACDAKGSQIPECQGFILAVASELKIRIDENTKWYVGTESGLQEMDFTWWFTD